MDEPIKIKHKEDRQQEIHGRYENCCIWWKVFCQAMKLWYSSFLFNFVTSVVIIQSCNFILSRCCRHRCKSELTIDYGMSFSLSLIFFVALDFPGLMITCCLSSRSRCVTEFCVYTGTGLWRPVLSWALSQAPSGNSLIVWLEGPRVDTYTMMRVIRPIVIYSSRVTFVIFEVVGRRDFIKRSIEFLY